VVLSFTKVEFVCSSGTAPATHLRRTHFADGRSGEAMENQMRLPDLGMGEQLLKYGET